MNPFKTHEGKAVLIDRANIDTDAIIPKQFLKSIKRTGYGENLFFDDRYLPNGQPNPSFELNLPAAKGATILVARNNFGCGSSREHAVWSVVQYGLKVVIAPRQGEIPAFADIFYNNSIKNGLLCVELPAQDVDTIFQLAQQGQEIAVDLEKQKVTLKTNPEKTFEFQIDPSVKDHLLRGLDDIGLTLQHEADVSSFEKKHQAQQYWN